MIKNKYETGSISWSLVAIIGLTLISVTFGSLAIWSYVSYNEQKTNVDAKIAVAEADAKKAQAEVDEKKFAEREKEPNRAFVGPEDYGRLTFDYPKTWSVYIATDENRGGSYQAYLNPVTVPPVGNSQQQYALRVNIENNSYDSVIESYQPLVKEGDLRSSPVSVNGVSGTRFDGNFSQDIRGAAVIYKIRDKTVTIRTDADTFKPDFENVIKTIKFNT